MLPQFYTGASKSLRIKLARQEPAVTGVIFKHLTVHETLKPCLTPSPIPALDSGRLRRRRSFSPGMVVTGFLRLVPEVTPDTSSSRISRGSCSEHRGPAPRTGVTGGCHRAPKGSWGRRGTTPSPGTARSRRPPPANLRQLAPASPFLPGASG